MGGLRFVVHGVCWEVAGGGNARAWGVVRGVNTDLCGARELAEGGGASGKARWLVGWALANGGRREHGNFVACAAAGWWRW
jgi:hypothetical protein